MRPDPLTVDRLEHWLLSGASWRVVEICAERAIVDFCTCTGELVERVGCEDSAVITYLRTAHPEQA